MGTSDVHAHYMPIKLDGVEGIMHIRLCWLQVEFFLKLGLKCLRVTGCVRVWERERERDGEGCLRVIGVLGFESLKQILIIWDGVYA